MSKKWYGQIGFAKTVERGTDIYVEDIVERSYTGDLIRNIRRMQSGEYLNDDLNVNNQLSILADPFAYHNFQTMRYVEIYGQRWKVSSVEVQYPRLILEIGGAYSAQPGGSKCYT